MEDKQQLGEIVIFRNEDGEVKVQIDAVNETIWLNQKGMAELFAVTPQNITLHLKAIYNEGELVQDATCKEILQVQIEGGRQVRRTTKYYNLDAIIAVGYRVNSKRATQFRIWATNILRSYLVKGFALDDERFKNGYSLSYFRELLDRIREIRLSERVFYQQIKDIYALSIDYDKNDQHTIEFYAKVQNKLLWAVSGQTGAELVYYRANAALPNMGLTSTQTKGKVRALDAGIGKNYLHEQEIKNLKLIVEQYLSFAEAQAINHIPMRMADWEKNLDIILTMNRKNILQTKGRITKEMAKKKARTEYKKFKEKEKDRLRLKSIKELDADIKELTKRNNPPKSF